MEPSFFFQPLRLSSSLLLESFLGLSMTSLCTYSLLIAASYRTSLGWELDWALMNCLKLSSWLVLGSTFDHSEIGPSSIFVSY
jgi:hypothetical protein